MTREQQTAAIVQAIILHAHLVGSSEVLDINDATESIINKVQKEYPHERD